LRYTNSAKAISEQQVMNCKSHDLRLLPSCSGPRASAKGLPLLS